MKRSVKALWSGFVNGRFSLLLLSLLAMFFVLPLVNTDRRIIESSLVVFNILVVISCMRVAVSRRGLFFLLVFLGVINTVIATVQAAAEVEYIWLSVLVLVLRLGYYVLVFLSIMKYVLNRDKVTTDKICGAICAYALIGLIWASIYSLFYTLDPTSFAIPENLHTGHGNSLWSLYFSFISLTTLGYGDITPLSAAAQTYAYLEAACGQIFLTVLVARLVALHIIHESDRK